MASEDCIKSSPKRQKINNQNVYDPTYIYLLFNEEWSCFKIGISRCLEVRLEQHRMNRFVLVDKQNRVDAERVERKLLSFIRGNFQTGSELFENQFDGWTECWHKDDLSPSSIDELIKIAENSPVKVKAKKRKDTGTGWRISDLDFDELFAYQDEVNKAKLVI